MSENTNLVPKRRFKEFQNAEDWKQRKLGDIGEFKNGMNFSKDAMGHGYPFVNLQNVFGRSTIEDENLGLAESTEIQRKDYSLEKGDVLFIRSSVKPEGVGEAAIVPKTLENTTYSGFIIRLRPYESMSDRFNAVVYSTKPIRKQILMGATSSANTNINQDTLQKIQISIPEIKEQEQIGIFFAGIDNLIALQQRKLEKTKSLKSAYLSELFPAKGELKPKLRFTGFTGPWEQRKLKDVSTYSNGGSFENDVQEKGRYELITLKSVDMSGNLVHSGRYIDIEVPTLVKGTLVMILSEQSPGLLGMTAQIPKDNAYVLNQRVAEIRPNQNVDGYFLSMAINRNQQYFSRCGAGTKVQNISKSNVENYEFLCPLLDEQKKISTFFKHLDNLIVLHKRKLEKLQNIKKAYLNEMFI